ncbi:polysaccharide deacetylase family protein [Micromonospora parathelypteridis]|uniref:Peptidoglycan/xylan/chitin deacetylase (PgdA/CDA1 family) n=1 Tax=Micromonospora parathelypteridis TaxID=1839617 RepID=A0A840VT81_9ACTN|nr:polysaccharide deacetylase family protein [Micromonospora parathelypteridis]MBB5479915.1 peptidoglycan/xylan/chitin deacetylase (PgdA/CDA1 family) [Micromonospora parathelypteridis]
MLSAPVRRIVAAVTLPAILALSSCTAGPGHAAHARQVAAGPPSPSAPPPTPSTSPSPTAKPAPGTLEWYVSQVPTFPEAPPPQPVQLPATGPAPIWHRLPTEQKVAFITIDDGGLARPPAVADFIWQAHIPVTMFLNSPAAEEHDVYFRQIEVAGGVVENHTIRHTSLAGRSYDHQKQEICGAADKLEALFGKRPTLFRPPFGEHDTTTLQAAHDCGAKAVFHWTETVHEGKVRYQTPEKVVHPGDVLLMHFRPALMDDLLAALKAIHRAGLTPALLEDYVR